jgi:hypothetical protein
VHELLDDEVITVEYVNQSQNYADPLIKDIVGEMIYKTSKGMRLRSIK